MMDLSLGALASSEVVARGPGKLIPSRPATLTERPHFKLRSHLKQLKHLHCKAVPT